MRGLATDDPAVISRFYEWLSTPRRVAAVHSCKWAEILVSGVWAGALAIVRSQAWELAGSVGGTPQNGVTKTDFLVCGYQDLWKLAAGETKSHKLRHAEELHAAGQPIEVLTRTRLLSHAPRSRVVVASCLGRWA